MTKYYYANWWNKSPVTIKYYTIINKGPGYIGYVNKLKTKLNDVAMDVAMAADLTDKIVTCHSRWRSQNKF